MADNRNEIDALFADSVEHAELSRQGSALVTIARNLRNARKAVRMTQSEVADAAGTTQAKISDIERAQNLNPEFRTLERVSHAVGLSFSELVSARYGYATFFAGIPSVMHGPAFGVNATERRYRSDIDVYDDDLKRVAGQ